jgi:hypothetical protein
LSQNIPFFINYKRWKNLIKFFKTTTKYSSNFWAILELKKIVGQTNYNELFRFFIYFIGFWIKHLKVALKIT